MPAALPARVKLPSKTAPVLALPLPLLVAVDAAELAADEGAAVAPEAFCQLPELLMRPEIVKLPAKVLVQVPLMSPICDTVTWQVPESLPVKLPVQLPANSFTKFAFK